MRHNGVDYPEHGTPEQRKPLLKPLPCPFCGKPPRIGPKDPEREGNAWGEVFCGNTKCLQPTARDGCDVAGDYGTGWYIDQAIKRWNKRAP